MLDARFVLRVTAVTLFAVAMIPVTVLAVAGNGKVIEPMFCETDLDSAVIGSISADLGEEVLVPVYVESNECINNFRFVFIFPANLDYAGVEEETWTGGWDTPIYNSASRTLIVEHSTGGTCMTPDINDAFLSLRVTTHCKTVHNVSLPITWGLSDPENPSIFLGHATCNRDPFTTRNGSVSVNLISITFDIGTASALIGDEVVVTVTCANSYLFNSFSHRIEWDEAVLAPVLPLADPTGRTAGYLSSLNFGAITFVFGSKPDGYGTSAADGADFYQLHFQVISQVDDVSGYVRFDQNPEATALDCDQDLRLLTPSAVSGTNGAVNIPPYLAVFDLGEAAWNNASSCGFRVPVLLKNNYPVTKFRLSVEYSADAGLPLVSTGVESANPLDWPLTWGGIQSCSGNEYTIFRTFGETDINIEPSGDFRTIGWINFENGSPTASELAYTLRVLDFGCSGDDDPTWAKTYDEVRLETQYDLGDPQLNSDTGSVIVGNPLAEVIVPSATAECHKPPIPMDCDHFATSSLLVRANADLDQVEFYVTWDATQGCVNFPSLAPGATLISQSTGVAWLRVNSVQASANWQWFGTVRVTNAKYYNQTMVVNVSSVTATESCTHTAIPANGLAGSFGLYALEASQVSCIPAGNGTKVAGVPDQYELIQNYPNPFNASTLINFNLTTGAHTRLVIYNIMGQRVRTLMDDYTEAGPYSIRWDGRDANGSEAATGVYLYRLESGGFTATRKMVLLK